MTTTLLPYIDEATLFELVPFRDAVSALGQSLVDGLDPAASLQRSIHDMDYGQLLLMPAETHDAAGVKLSTVAPGNPDLDLPRVQALYVLYDRETLTPTALLDGTALTTIRTPAVSAVAVDHLVCPDAGHLVVFGSGPQAWGHVEAIRAVRPLRKVTVVGRNQSRAEDLATRLRSTGLDASPGSAESVAHADVVVCATTSRQPLFDGGWLREGACVVAVGSHEPDAREIDAETFRSAARVVVETRDVAMREAGDAILAVESGALSVDELIDLGEVVRLQPTSGKSVFKSVGMGWQDLVVAEVAHRRWTEKARV
jgi:ornithine cyclodeaminase/alanine dehydrogenase-like protein (mu-crystallin family)